MMMMVMVVAKMMLAIMLSQSSCHLPQKLIRDNCLVHANTPILIEYTLLV